MPGQWLQTQTFARLALAGAFGGSMPVRPRRWRAAIGAALIAAGVLSYVTPAVASRPVPRTITGCVSGGTFTSDDGYVIRAKGANFEDYDLGRFEGRRISVRGMLSPGDLFAVKGRPRDLGPCRRPR